MHRQYREAQQLVELIGEHHDLSNRLHHLVDHRSNRSLRRLVLRHWHCVWLVGLQVQLDHKERG